MKVGDLKQRLEKENDDDEVSVGLDMESGSIVASLSVYRPREDEVVDIITENYVILGFSAGRKG